VNGPLEKWEAQQRYNFRWSQSPPDPAGSLITPLYCLDSRALSVISHCLRATPGQHKPPNASISLQMRLEQCQYPMGCGFRPLGAQEHSYQGMGTQ
jgi:hypothetical protein